MKTFALILVMFATPLAAQNKQPQITAPPQTAAQSPSTQISRTKAPSATQHPQTVFKPTAKPVQTQPRTLTAKEFYEYEDRIIDRSEKFYDRQMTHLLWTMGSLMAIGGTIIGILIPMNEERRRKINYKKELTKQSRKFEKALASDSGIHFMEHAKNLPYSDDNAIEKLCLVLYAIANFAKSEETGGIHDCLEAIRVLQLPNYSMGRDINEEHNRMLSRYNMAYTAIKENGFEERFKTKLKSVVTKIEDWYSNLPENKKPDESAIGG